MSVTKRSKEENKATKAKKPTKAPKNYVNFHPTKEEKDELKDEQKFNLEWGLLVISNYLDGRASLSVGYAGRTDSYYATLREKSDNWQDARSLSCFHSDPSRAIIGLAFSLERHYDDFPNVESTIQPRDLEW